MSADGSIIGFTTMGRRKRKGSVSRDKLLLHSWWDRWLLLITAAPMIDLWLGDILIQATPPTVPLHTHTHFYGKCCGPLVGVSGDTVSYDSLRLCIFFWGGGVREDDASIIIPGGLDCLRVERACLSSCVCVSVCVCIHA